MKLFKINFKKNESFILTGLNVGNVLKKIHSYNIDLLEDIKSIIELWINWFIKPVIYSVVLIFIGEIIANKDYIILLLFQ
jgi:hypothetical protein